MITDIYYSFNKKDYFNYFFLTVGLYILLQKSLIFNLESLVPIIITLGIVYFLTKRKTILEFAKMENQNNKLKKIQIDKYPFLNKDIYVIDCINKLHSLSSINRLKFKTILDSVNNFFKYYNMHKHKNLRPYDLYVSAKDNSKRALNALKSFVTDINKYPYLEKDRNISRDRFLTDNNFIYKCSIELEKRFSIYLTEMEIKNNSDWNKGDINIYSKPIYPDEENAIVNSDVLHSNNYSMY